MNSPRSSTAASSPTQSLTSTWRSRRPSTSGPLDGLPRPPTPRPPIHHREPGNTTGTQAPSDIPLPMRVAAKYLMPALGLAHKLDVGAKRLVDGVTDPTLSSGACYASAAGKLTGPLVNQADFFARYVKPVVS